MFNSYSKPLLCYACDCEDMLNSEYRQLCLEQYCYCLDSTGQVCQRECSMQMHLLKASSDCRNRETATGKVEEMDNWDWDGNELMA